MDTYLIVESNNIPNVLKKFIYKEKTETVVTNTVNKIIKDELTSDLEKKEEGDTGKVQTAS